MTERWNDDELRAAYAPLARDRGTGHRPDCPSAESLLAAVRGEGSEVERLRVLDTALKCATCRRELALLHAVSGTTAEQARSASIYSWRRVVPLAAAAAIVLVLGLFGIQRFLQGPSDIVRAGSTTGPTLVTPASGSAVVTGPVSFTWRSVAGALRYTFEISTSGGTVLASATTTDTVAIAALREAPTGEHRWWVRAHMNDGSERRSDTRLLRIR